MGFKANDLGGDGPKPGTGHLGLLHAVGQVTAIPPGAGVYIIEDSTNVEKIFPLVLFSVSRRKLVFVCPCHQCKTSPNPVKLSYVLSKGTAPHFSEKQRTTPRDSGK